MKRVIYLVFFSFWAINCFATHIVGGEIRLEPIQSNLATHRVTLNLYFDAINGNPGAEDLTLTVYFFSKKTNEFAGSAVLQRVSRDFIKYNTPACERGDLKTLLIKYQADIVLTSEKFSDPAGYYVVWDRCCRNATITNIKTPNSVGMLFYLEFPPVTLKNTSPKFNDIVSDYICINQQFFFDFSAFDVDGDSLSYQLITPWVGNSSPSFPLITPTGSSTYKEVTWNDDYSLTNIMGGDQPLVIDPFTGVLTIKSSKLGLFVFSVMVEEFRKGIKIGRVKRDFQLKVIDCQLNVSPVLVVKNTNSTTLYNDSEIIFIKKNDKKCFDITFTDADIGQIVNITAKGLNFDSQQISIALPNQLTITKKGDSLKTQVCLGNCAITKNNDPIQFVLTVTDNGCPASLKKSVLVKVQFEEATPLDPKISTSLSDNSVNVMYGDTLRFKVNGQGVPNDTIQLLGASSKYTFSSLGIIFNQPIGITSVNADFTFIPTCSAVVAGKIPVTFTTKEFRCSTSKQVSTSVLINVLDVPNNKPIVATSLLNNQIEVILNPSEKQEISFNVNGQDADKQQLMTNVLPKGFDLANAGMTFANQNGISKTNGIFTWKPTCEILNGTALKEYDISFLTTDNACISKQDSVKVHLTLKDVTNADLTFKPYNTFTPNNDGFNDYFSLENIPNDNCKRQFISFEIYNRWGTSIFTTFDRKFQWSGENFSAGEYFYALKFSDEVFKGIIHLIR